MAAPDSPEPPAPSTPTSANWLAPVKTSSDSTQVCHRLRPEVTEIAPKDTPYAPDATPIAIPSRAMRRSIMRWLCGAVSA